jgi:2-methylcitrate dehydratase
MTYVQQLAEFAVRASYDRLPHAVREHLKTHILDSLGCAIGAIGSEPVQLLRRHLAEFGSGGSCTLIAGGRASPRQAALYNGALIRYLDFNDSYLAKGETCHPSDNLAAILAAAEYRGASGRELITALAVAYQVQCRMSDAAPVRAAGFDHTVQGAYAVAAGVARALGLDAERTAHAIAISGAALNALRVTRTGPLSHWKGLAYPYTAACAAEAVFLAREGITGPLEVVEGEKGLMQAITGPFSIDWRREDFDRVLRTILKKYNAEIHSQTAIEGLLELRREHAFEASDVERISIAIFDVAYQIIGGGEEGNKVLAIRAKEQADHSLPYILAAALLDGTVMPEQYRPERIRQADVQEMLKRIVIFPEAAYSTRFPEAMPCRVEVSLRDGRILTKEMADYPGFFTRPMKRETVFAKFERLAAPRLSAPERQALLQGIEELESRPVSDLVRLLARARSERAA